MSMDTALVDLDNCTHLSWNYPQIFNYSRKHLRPKVKVLHVIFSFEFVQCFAGNTKKSFGIYIYLSTAVVRFKMCMHT